MRKALRWFGYLLGSVVVLILVTATALVARGTYLYNKVWDAKGVDVAVPTDSASVERGHRLAFTRGCLSCHEALAQGGVFFDEPNVARVVAPNIARIADEYTTLEFDGAVRHGVRRDGTGLSVMPSDMFSRLTDADIGAIIAFLRSVTPVADTLPKTELRILGRVGLALGQFTLTPQYIARDLKHNSVSIAPTPGDTLSEGRYIALTSCVECHGLTLHGTPADPTAPPNLAVMIAAYSLEQFTHLLRTGEPVGGRKLGLMALVAQKRYKHFNGGEIAAIYRYLKSQMN